MTTFIDTNVLIGVTKPSDAHHAWATQQFMKCKANGPAVITDMVFCEFSSTLLDLDEVNKAVNALGLERYPTDDAALFRAGKAFLQYRKQGGPKNRVLPDFLIGAVAEVANAPLLTANPGDFEKYFPQLNLIQP